MSDINQPDSLATPDEPFWSAIRSGDVAAIQAILDQDDSLAGRNFQPDSLHTDGFPLFQATRQGNFAMVRLLLDHGADPDARLDSDDPRETGMPLMNAFHGKHREIVDLLLDRGASLWAFPYCSTPFVDCVCNATWDCPEQKPAVDELIRKSFQHYLNRANVGTLALPDLTTAPQPVGLLERVVDRGGFPSLFTVVRHQPAGLIEDLLRMGADQPGTRMDWPRGTVFENICYAASWLGYPEVLDQCRELCPTLFSPDVAKQNIERAIRSHNRDGGIREYESLIRSQLELLKQNHAITESCGDGKPFLPLHWLADDFVEPENYGFRCRDLSTPADLNRLARLFLEYGVDVNSVCPETDHTPLQAAQKADQAAYVKLLKQLGAH